MSNRNLIPQEDKTELQARQGIATVELLIALPLITAAFVTLMFIAHASHQKNGDYHRLYLTGMSRHTLQPPEFNPTKTTELEPTELSQAENLVSRAFPATEMWAVTASQPLGYVPSNFQHDDWNTKSFSGALYQGTGSPEYRTEDMVSPPEDQVRELAISALADSLGNKLGINLSQANEFLNLLTALTGSEFERLPAEAQDLQVSDLVETQQDSTAGFNELENELNNKIKEREAKQSELSALEESINPNSGDVDLGTAERITKLKDDIKALDGKIELLTPQRNEVRDQLGTASELFSGIRNALENLGKSEN